MKCSHQRAQPREGHTCGEHGCGSPQLPLRRITKIMSTKGCAKGNVEVTAALATMLCDSHDDYFLLENNELNV